MRRGKAGIPLCAHHLEGYCAGPRNVEQTQAGLHVPLATTQFELGASVSKEIFMLCLNSREDKEEAWHLNKK